MPDQGTYQVLRAPFHSDCIPDTLKQATRWAPWRAAWSERRHKFDKIPHSVAPPHYGLSTTRPQRWGSFDAAHRALLANAERFAGLGYVMTGVHGLVGVDLDRCVVDGAVADWAQAIVDRLCSYTEISPSSTGLRIFVLGAIDADWTNHEQGIEVYGGHEPRFLTVTGAQLAHTPNQVRAAPAGVLEDLAAVYARERSAAAVISLEIPELIDELALPDLSGLSWRTQDLLAEGLAEEGDRSKALWSAAVDMHAAGLTEAEVLSVLVSNPHTHAIALDKRRGDPDRALMFLWVEYAQKAKGRGISRVASADDFEVVGPARSARAVGGAEPLAKFDIVPAWQYLRRKPMRWLLKGVLPEATLGAVFGASGAGKSFFVLDLVLSLARGVDWRGHRCKKADVLYVAAEGAAGVMQRLQAHQAHHSYDMQSVGLFMLAAAPNLLDKKAVDELVVSIQARCTADTRLIVIDTLAQVTPGANENGAEDMGRALTQCRRIHEALGVMVLLVAHAGKDGEKGIRGWSGIKAALDVEILVEKDLRSHEATITKMKDGTNEGARYPFSLSSVVLGQDEDGDDVSSAVVLHRDAAPGAKVPRRAKVTGDWQKAVMRVAGTLLDLGGSVTTQQLMEATINEMPRDEAAGKDRRRERVFAALEALTANGHLSTAGGAVGIPGEDHAA